jgi:hypothetical protein
MQKQDIGDGKTMLVLIFFMHKVEALPTNCRMHCSVQG